jgi:hypothetical protein
MMRAGFGVRRQLLSVGFVLFWGCATASPEAGKIAPVEKGSTQEFRSVREICIFAGHAKPGHETEWANAKATIDLRVQHYFDAQLGTDTLRVVACRDKTVAIWLYDTSVAVQVLLPGDCSSAPCFRELFRHPGTLEAFLPSFVAAYREANAIASRDDMK